MDVTFKKTECGIIESVTLETNCYKSTFRLVFEPFCTDFVSFTKHQGFQMKYEKNALLIGHVAGIPIRLHISLLIVIGFFSLFSGLGLIGTLILAFGLFGSVALHELGHSFMARAKGSYIHEIVLYPFGGAAKISNIPKKPIDEALVALAGPAVSLLLGIIGLSIGNHAINSNPELTSAPLSWHLGRLNMALFIFNILPVFPMDGGRVLRAVLQLKRGRVEATRIAAQVGKYFCGLFVIIGLLGMPFQLFGFIGPFRPSFMLAFIGGYIYMAGQQEYRMILFEQQANRFNYNQATDFIFSRIKNLFK
jgi:Zn-dependent protease